MKAVAVISSEKGPWQTAYEWAHDEYARRTGGDLSWASGFAEGYADGVCGKHLDATQGSPNDVAYGRGRELGEQQKAEPEQTDP